MEPLPLYNGRYSGIGPLFKSLIPEEKVDGSELPPFLSPAGRVGVSYFPELLVHQTCPAGVWQHRNKIYYQGGRQSVFGLVSFIKAYYTETSNVEAAIATNIMQNDNAWNPPTMNVVKANFDASFDRQDHSSVAGIIFRDSEEHILAACTYPNKFVADTTTTEARACLQSEVGKLNG
ncbi:hypothetical protein PVK06_048051 [Gossypium arboreum]|uniref:RNase H type-1 domain-containing protein n=1 Tax=Gossypium arboreum TaxID=29729 RepID=A0ABR0MEV8_GOSAR|nr:hypothetical protein PVK06_048051 [Gossypium arboreum]